MGKFFLFILLNNNSILVIKKFRKLLNSSSAVVRLSCSSLIEAPFLLACDFRMFQVLCWIIDLFSGVDCCDGRLWKAEATGIISHTSRENWVLTLCQMLSYWIRWWHSMIYSIIWRPTCSCRFPHSPSVLWSPPLLPRTSGNLGNRVWIR